MGGCSCRAVSANENTEDVVDDGVDLDDNHG